ncbi:MAG: outer membrane beta-barrel protein [Thiolinea sp.]
MKYLVALTTLPLLVFSSCVLAGGGYPGSTYVGASLGSTNSDANNATLSDPDTCNLSVSDCSSDDKDKAWGLHAGYAFTPNLAVEGAYVHLGETANVSSRAVGGTLQGKQKTKGVSLSVVGTAPVGPVSAYGKAGIYHWNSDVKINGPSINNTADDSGTDPTVGLGVEYRFNNNTSARLGWDRYFNTGKDKVMLHSTGASTLETDVDVYSVGVNFNF